jgi:hypothetical protein
MRHLTQLSIASSYCEFFEVLLLWQPPLSFDFIVGSHSLLPKFLACFGQHVEAPFTSSVEGATRHVALRKTLK